MRTGEEVCDFVAKIICIPIENELTFLSQSDTCVSVSPSAPLVVMSRLCSAALGVKIFPLQTCHLAAMTTLFMFIADDPLHEKELALNPR